MVDMPERDSLTLEGLKRTFDRVMSEPILPPNPVFLPQCLYDRAAAAGYDMSCYQVQRPLPRIGGLE